MNSDPVITRAYPGTLWEYVPAALKSWESGFQAWLMGHINLAATPWVLLRWLTENPYGVAASFGVGIVGLLLFWRRQQQRSHYAFTRRNIHRFIVRAFLIFAATGAADAFSLLIKRGIGRLKPRVDRFAMVDPWPAFSMPSSHAFNSAFLYFLVRGLLSIEERRVWRWPLRLCFGWLAMVGISRVLFSEHYPLDVLCGWLSGGLLGAALAMASRRPWRKRAIFSSDVST